MQCDSVGASHHYFRRVFIHGTLAVSHIGDVLNHHLKWHAETVNKSHRLFFFWGLIIFLRHSHSGQVSLPAGTIWGLTGPCHPPRCSWKSLWSGTAEEPTGSSRRCCRGDCSWRWRWAVEEERSLLKSLCSENTWLCKFIAVVLCGVVDQGCEMWQFMLCDDRKYTCHVMHSISLQLYFNLDNTLHSSAWHGRR